MPKSLGSYIKIHAREDWFMALVHAVRSRYIARKETELTVTPEKLLANRVNDAISHAIKAEVASAKHEHTRVSKSEFPPFIKVGFGTSVLTVSACVKNIMIETGNECFEWMGAALVEEIENIFM